jgi:hypothetical protein
MKKTTILCGLGLWLSVICVGSLLVSQEAMAWTCPVATYTFPTCNKLTLVGSYVESCGAYTDENGHKYTPTCNGTQYTTYCCSSSHKVSTAGTTVNLDGCVPIKVSSGGTGTTLFNDDGTVKCSLKK